MNGRWLKTILAKVVVVAKMNLDVAIVREHALLIVLVFAKVDVMEDVFRPVIWNAKAVVANSVLLSANRHAIIIAKQSVQQVVIILLKVLLENP